MFPGGLYGSGMHNFVLDEMELGTRVAAALDEEACYGAEIMLLWNDELESM